MGPQILPNRDPVKCQHNSIGCSSPTVETITRYHTRLLDAHPYSPRANYNVCWLRLYDHHPKWRLEPEHGPHSAKFGWPCYSNNSCWSFSRIDPFRTWATMLIIALLADIIFSWSPILSFLLVDHFPRHQRFPSRTL